jgi:serine phosphatase RsbU (regulator of sigma subunit)
VPRLARAVRALLGPAGLRILPRFTDVPRAQGTDQGPFEIERRAGGGIPHAAAVLRLTLSPEDAFGGRDKVAPLTDAAENRSDVRNGGGAPLADRPKQVVAPAPALPADARASANVGEVLERISRGTRLEEILDFIFEKFRGDIPFDRISLATVDAATERLVARWARSEGNLRIAKGYSMALADTSLAALLALGRPRIIDDLESYLDEHPRSEGTRLLVAEGLRSSLTCPLMVNGRPTGFLFFNSRRRGAYSDSHIGAFEHVATTVAMLFELGRLFDELAAQKVIVDRQGRQLAEDNNRHKRELALARGVQRALIQGDLPEDHYLRSEMLYEPATVIGGDLVDCVPLDRNRALFCVADALGHGVPAALVMSVIRTALHGALGQRPEGRTDSPAALLRTINRTLTELLDQQYVTAVIACVDARDRTVALSLAGHPPAMLLRSGSGRVEAVAARHVPLGISAATEFTDIELPFVSGDVLFLYTDGVVEAEDAGENAFGRGGLRAALEAWHAASDSGLARYVRAAVAGHVRSAPLADDLAILAVHHRSAAARRAHW